jgi:hypothetical protein
MVMGRRQDSVAYLKAGLGPKTSLLQDCGKGKVMGGFGDGIAEAVGGTGTGEDGVCSIGVGVV